MPDSELPDRWKWQAIGKLARERDEAVRRMDELLAELGYGG